MLLQAVLLSVEHGHQRSGVKEQLQVTATPKQGLEAPMGAPSISAQKPQESSCFPFPSHPLPHGRLAAQLRYHRFTSGLER